MSEPGVVRPPAMVPRRRLLRGLLALGGAAMPSPPGSAHAQASPPGGGGGAVDAEAAVRRAMDLRLLAEARGDQPYGAVVVLAGRIVGEGASAVIVRQDPTAHAEMEAIRDACRRLGTRDLRGATIHSTARPCPMCETAAYWANLSRMHVGLPATDAGAPRYPSC